jgi:hypothetical protein
MENHFEHAGIEGEFADDELHEFVSIHNEPVLLLLSRLPSPIRRVVEWFIILGPIAGFLIYLLKEEFMAQFFHEGGAAMWAILAIGIVLLVREALTFMRVVMLRDHSKTNLNLDSSSVLVGTLALMAVGIGAGALGVYVSVTSAASSGMSPAVLMLGLKESMTNVILGTTFAALILMLHYTTRKILLHWRAPLFVTENG